MEQWVQSYRALAERIVADQVTAMQEEFPKECYPVRPPYRRAMYQRLMLIVDELNKKMTELLHASPDEADEELKTRLMALQEGYEQTFITKVRKEDNN